MATGARPGRGERRLVAPARQVGGAEPRDDLGAVPDGIGLARATFTTIRRNIGWAFGYNFAAIPLAAAGLLNPIIAAAAMALSSAFVVWNSVRLRKFASPAAEPGPSAVASVSEAVGAERRLPAATGSP